MNIFETAVESTAEIVALEALTDESVRRGVAHWQELRGPRPYPDRAEILPRALGAALRDVILVKVIADGADYEYRLVGDAVAQGFKENFAGQYLSQLAARSPKFGKGLRQLYEKVRRSGTPLGFRGQLGNAKRSAELVRHESVVLPFGPEGGPVDHLLIVNVLATRSKLTA